MKTFVPTLKLRELFLIAAVAMGLGTAGVSNAAFNGQYDFGTLLTGTGGGATVGGPSSATFAHLSVVSTDDITFNFRLDVYNNLSTVFGSGAFVGSLLVNTYGVDPTGNGSNQITGAGSGVSAVVLSTSNNSAGGSGYSWDFKDSFCALNNSGNCSSSNSTEAGRLIGNEFVTWATTFTTSQVPPFDTPPFLLHVQGYGNSSKWTPLPLVTPIPEPEIYAMMGLGLGLMGFVARRRKQQAAA